MVDLTSRQIQILRAVIEEYLDTAEPVGSERIEKKYDVGVSPATIRNEMAMLTDQGYLNQPHTSAGRIPTPMALKLYVRELMHKRDVSVADEISMKDQVWDSRNDIRALLRQTAKTLAQKTRTIGIAYTDELGAYSSGYGFLFNNREFEDVNVARTVLTLIEETKQLREIFSREWGNRDEPVRIVFGAELGNEYLAPVSLMFTEVQVGPQICTIGVIGPCRMHYPRFVPMLERFHDIIGALIPSEKV